MRSRARAGRPLPPCRQCAGRGNDRIPDEGAHPIEQAVIDSPGVDPDPGELDVVLVCGDVQRRLDLRPQAQNIPMQAIGQAHRVVGEAMNVR